MLYRNLANISNEKSLSQLENTEGHYEELYMAIMQNKLSTEGYNIMEIKEKPDV